ncbi:NAD(P)-binding domain-containing protein [Microbacterium sp. NPDC055903]
MQELPVIVIGAGPQGLAAAAHLTEHGIDALVLERGASAGAAVSDWGHVRLFSAWPELTDAAARRLLTASGWSSPTSGYPTGQEWIDTYLAPLATALGERVRFGVTVTGITRRGRDKVMDDDRAAQPFVVRTLESDGVERSVLARAVIDASGTWSTPNPAGGDGLPAIGEAVAAERNLITYRIPADPAADAGRTVVVLGAGHSAIQSVLQLIGIAERDPRTRVIWALRRTDTGNTFGGGQNDALPERAALGTRARKAVHDGLVEIVTGFRVSAFEQRGAALDVRSDDGRVLTGVGHVYALTGFRPDTSILREMRIDLDEALDAVAGIASEIDPNIHSCGTVAATGAAQLVQPEQGLFIVGAKSYGRAPTFLALTGFEQVRSVVAHLAGDAEAAARNELTLPATGVCGGIGASEGDAGCCTPTLLSIGRRPVGAS